MAGAMVKRPIRGVFKAFAADFGTVEQPESTGDR